MYTHKVTKGFTGRVLAFNQKQVDGAQHNQKVVWTLWTFFYVTFNATVTVFNGALKPFQFFLF